MIILPDRHAPVGRLLMPMARREWIASSQRPSFEPLAHGTLTRYKLTARLHDGHPAWVGWFDDREDADAFLFSAASGTLLYERELWDLPSPHWRPGMGEELAYEFATLVFLTAPTGSTQTYTSPIDWNNLNNSISTIGGGASGATNGATAASGGGGAAFNKTTNFSFATPGTTTATYQIAASAAGVSGTADGTAGNSSWFNGTTLGGSTVGSVGGSQGLSNAGPGGAGGVGSSGKGSSNNNGGTGGTVSAGSTSCASGAGGAAGPNGNGSNGVNNSTANSSTAGGNGGASGGGAGSAGGGASSSAGGNGTEFDASHGSGGGSGGTQTAGSVTTAGAGGNYGGGGGAATTASGASRTSGVGQQGIVHLNYTPVVTRQFNLAMRGM
jgi:hypothetical protein